MENLVKLTYMFLMKHDINIPRWRALSKELYKYDTPDYRIVDVICAQLDSTKHGLDILDVIKFMENYE